MKFDNEKICHSDNEKRKKINSRRNNATEIYQESIKRLGEKENFKYLGIVKEDTIKQVEMKERNKKRVPHKNEKASRNQKKRKLITMHKTLCQREDIDRLYV